jgi:arylsulfatase A-like enzyme
MLGGALSGLAFIAVVLAILSRPDPSGNPRPIGSADDILSLKERADVNVLFILIDTLRAERLSAYGYERETSPFLEYLASSGVRFGRHLSQSSWTKCSMASLWTGLYPARTGVTRFDHMVAPEAQMAAESLKEAGFQTVGLYRNGWVSPNFGFDQGFDVYTRPGPGPTNKEVVRENPTISQGGTDEDVVQTAIEYLRVNGRDRWFLYMHLMDVHEYTYDQESALFGGGYSDIYDNSIRRTDSMLAYMLDYLNEAGLADKTLVIIGSDHGEAFRERGVEGHARRVFRETTEVPLFISFPFRLEEEVVLQTRTQNVDLWPTVLDLLGLPVEEDLDGRSVVPEIVAAARGQALPADSVTGVAHLDQTWGQQTDDPWPSIAITSGTKRYVLSDEGGGKPTEQLFDSEGDPTERVNHSQSDPEELARLRAMGESYLELAPPWGDAPTRDLNEMELNQLRALGYALP